ncbi:uncharacterized protein LOC143848920 [Tasmannia lanceolata]|uniref:uncharacterized protein LOC143848920 n=1 Tax=Tasmannia lanceolata TaxID=3420 RepID=UPI00406424A8
MSSGCISSSCVDARVPVRATYVNRYKWPESDAEFVKSVTNGGGGYRAPRVVDSYSCRQMYLRSYTFSKKESVQEKTRKCLGKVKEKVGLRRKVKGGGGGNRKRCLALRKVRELSCATLFSIFNRLLSCTTTIDVADR